MKGAHCLDCKEAGPDLVVSVESPIMALLEVAASYELSFDCGACGETWTWNLVLKDGEVRYENPKRGAVP